VKDRLAGVALKVGNDVAVTVNVTATVLGEPDAPEAAILTVPVYVPADSPEGLTDTATVPGVLPLAGFAVSHVAEVDTV
jgi:hypothetical protein